MQHAHAVAHRPVDVEQSAQAIGLFLEIQALFLEFIHLVPLPTKGPHHPHAGQVFLQYGAHGALGLVGGLEGLHHPFEKQVGEEEEPRHHDHAVQGQAGVAPQQHRQGHRDHQDGAQDGHELVDQEFAHGVHVAGAALHQIARFRLNVVAEGQALDVVVQLTAQIPGHVFARLALPAAPQEVAQAAETAQGHQQQAHDPQMTGHVFRAAQGVHPAVDEGGHGAGQTAEVMIQRFCQQQGCAVIRRHRRQGAQGRPGKQAPVPGDQPPHQAESSRMHIDFPIPFLKTDTQKGRPRPKRRRPSSPVNKPALSGRRLRAGIVHPCDCKFDDHGHGAASFLKVYFGNVWIVA